MAEAKESPSVVQVTEQTYMRKQISFAIAKLLNGDDIILRATPSNMGKAIRMAEIIKMRIDFLHQVNDFEKPGKILSPN